MSRGLLYRLLICIFALALLLYASIDKQNEITELEIYLPQLFAELQQTQERNAQLQFQIDHLESPRRLFALLKKPEFSHLLYPKDAETVYVTVAANHEQAK
ncbi:MAG: hypothetical protein AAF443_04965 [Chlamydiota bacterium]